MDDRMPILEQRVDAYLRQQGVMNRRGNYDTKWAREIAAMSAQAPGMEAMRPWLKHDKQCYAGQIRTKVDGTGLIYDEHMACTCGLDAALQAAERVRG